MNNSSKSLFVFLVLLLLASLATGAQDFDLYYAKNVTDATQFSDLKQLDQELTWRKMDKEAIDGNQDEVAAVAEMLRSTRMKGLADQQQFWRMRDHTLLCFRINDGSGTTGTYQVEVNYGTDARGNAMRRSLTTTSYFFANMPLQEHPITVRVWRTNNPDDFYQLRYWVYDWDDDNTYIFQLDQKRQSTGDTYRMQYVTSYTDEDGEAQTETNTLELRATAFQSLQVPEGHSLTELYFLTGNQAEGDVKLKVDVSNLHPGIDIDNKFNIPQLTSTFVFDKHERREMMNFNWMGTGLFEKYDTLYLKLYNQKGRIINRASINIQRVDANGNKVDDASLCYLGYDATREEHRILTYGHPAYIEILASGCLPTLYRYKGAAEADTRIVSEDLCSAHLTLKAEPTSASAIAITDQYLRYMEDACVVASRNGTDYSICTVKEIDLASKAAVDTLAFAEDAGTNYPKLLNNQPTERFAQLEVVFSTPKGSTSPDCNITATDIKSGVMRTGTDKEVRVVSTREFTTFTRDYYFLRLSLTDVVPRNSTCSLQLSTETATYDQFPLLASIDINPEEQKRAAEETSKKSTDTGNNSDKAARANNEGGLGIQFPTTFKFELGPMKMKTGFLIDVLKQTMNIYVSGAVNSNIDPQGTEEALSDARNNAKNVQNWNSTRFDAYPQRPEGERGASTLASFTEAKIDYEDWVKKESASIFDVNFTHVGFYYGGGFKIALQAPLANISHTQIQEASLFVEGGAGAFWSPKQLSGAIGKAATLLEKIHLLPDIGFVFDTNLRLDGGLKSFDNKMASTMSAKNLGLFTNLTFSSRLGAWATLRTPKHCWGSFQAGVRGGLKGSIQGGVAVPLDASDYGFGSKIMLLGIAEAFFDVRALFLHLSGSLYGRVGKQWLFPDDNTNPFHSDFPHWLESKTTSTVASSYRRLKTPEANALGAPLITDVAINANPHFLDATHVVYDDMKTANDYNDDCIRVLNTSDGTTETISPTTTAATQHMRSKRGSHEVVVYQQMTRNIDSDAITDDNVVTQTAAYQCHTQIRASIRKPDGTWKQTEVTPDDGFTDQMPVVSIQDDGHAACIYQHGSMQLIDDNVSPDSAFNHQLVGNLQLRTFDGNSWSEPTNLFPIDTDHQPTQYDLFMRGDTVLVGYNMTNAAQDTTIFRYASKPLASNDVTYVDEPLRPINFFMNRVGRNAVIAMLYERPDTTCEVFVKTLAMNGHGDGRSGCDLGLSQSTPSRVKIICDRSDDNANDFAVLWTENNNIIRDAAEGNSATDDMITVLNASRVHLSQTPTVTYPLTVGAERDSLFLTDFDGTLDDARINVVYTLAKPESGAAVVMQNEKYFTNSFESDVTYTRKALLGSGTLPVNVTIRNTGTSAIASADVTINGTTIAIDDSFVPPMVEKVFTVQYPIPDDFDGYISSQVSVNYQNVFHTNRHPRRKAMSFLRQVQTNEQQLIACNDIDCNVISRCIEDNGANTFVVELIDRSSRGLLPGTGVLLGIYPNPVSTATITGQAQTLVRPDDFHQTGAIRKAYATVYVSGITEPVPAYIVPHIVDTKPNTLGLEVVSNIRGKASAPFVNLFPSPEPTRIIRPSLDLLPTGHRIAISYEPGGIRLDNLLLGEDIRLFNPMGQAIYVEKAHANTLFIPLADYGVYILSGSDEVFKFKY